MQIVIEGEKLTDQHIEGSNCLLRKQFLLANGLQNPFKGQDLSFEVMKIPFVQILHNEGNHWLTIIAMDEASVLVYSSMHTNVNSVTKQQ